MPFITVIYLTDNYSSIKWILLTMCLFTEVIYKTVYLLFKTEDVRPIIKCYVMHRYSCSIYQILNNVSNFTFVFRSNFPPTDA